jgi:MYXO-CTERM domain-containing protein
MLGRSCGNVALTLVLLASATGPAAAQYRVDGLQGPVQPEEIQAFKQTMKAKLAAPDPNGPFNVNVGNRRNNYVYGLTADAVEGLLAVYEISGDQELMDQLIWFTDQMLLHRNDRFRKWVTFTGKVEPCWPNAPEDMVQSQWYCGTEVGDVVGHIAAVALMIVKNPALWPRPVPGPDPLQLGGTYLERARGYLRECRLTIDTFLTPHFVNPETRRFIWPVHPNYGDGSEKSIRARGKTVPWNQNTMLANGYLNVAEALERLGEEPATVAAYDAIVKAFTDGFFAKITRYTVMDQPVYNWSYASDDTGPMYRYNEDMGHGGYDFWGIYKAFARGKAGITREQMVPFANTLKYVIVRPDGAATANRVNGAGPDRGGLGSTWIYGAFVRPDLYQTIAGTMLAGAKRDPMTAGRLLHAKQMNARGWPGLPVGAAGDAGAPPSGSPDAAAPGEVDAAVRGGGGVPTPPPARGPTPAAAGGCACGTAQASPSGGGLLLVLAGVAALPRRRNRPVRRG